MKPVDDKKILEQNTELENNLQKERSEWNTKIPGIKESFVFGKPEKDDEKDLKICAELVYDISKVKAEYNVESKNEIKAVLWEKVKELNKTLSKYKYIKEIIITEEELIKTTTLKIKRFEEIKKVL